MFDTTPRVVTPSTEQPETAPAAAKGTKPAKSAETGKKGIQTWHILSAAAVILAGAIVLTSLPSTSQSHRAIAGPAPAVSGYRDDATHGDAAPTAIPPSQQEVIPRSELETASSSRVESQATAATAPQLSASTALAQSATANLPTPEVAVSPILPNIVMTQIAGLQGRMASNEDALTRIERKVDVLSDLSKVTKTDAPKPIKAKLATLRTTTTPAAENTATVRSLSGATYSINTIGRGYAWIQAGEHIDIVQAGDRIGKVRVLWIDVTDRKVVTSDGVIR